MVCSAGVLIFKCFLVCQRKLPAISQRMVACLPFQGSGQFSWLLEFSIIQRKVTTS